jgi:hypothetical protein
VSKGPDLVTVPLVEGLDAVAAEAQLAAAGFKVPKAITQTSDTVAAGLVIDTAPKGDTPAPRGSQVQIYVSSGKAKVPVPDLTGATSTQDVATRLAGAGLVPGTESTYYRKNAGYIAGSAQPAVGTLVDPGSAVDYSLGVTPSVTINCQSVSYSEYCSVPGSLTGVMITWTVTWSTVPTRPPPPPCTGQFCSNPPPSCGQDGGSTTYVGSSATFPDKLGSMTVSVDVQMPDGSIQANQTVDPGLGCL